ncbi:MAG: hypothetical protein KY432_08090 [Acidobacteria bacterium]|nr:hypothetical protein [Acidobacteriota bacterium]
MFPEHIERVLNHFGVSSETKSALHQLYLSMGDEVLEAFADLAAEAGGKVAEIPPEDLASLRWSVVRRYLGKHHSSWLKGIATPSFYKPRDLQGQASGITIPLGQIGREQSSLTEEIERKVRKVIGDSQPMPEGIVTRSSRALQRPAGGDLVRHRRKRPPDGDRGRTGGRTATHPARLGR